MHFQKRLSPSERRSREALIPAGPGMIQKWGVGGGRKEGTSQILSIAGWSLQVHMG